MNGMKSILDTMSSVDKNSKKMFLKHFDQKEVNQFKEHAPYLIKQLEQIESQMKV
jgi:hypothetical protein